MPVIRLQFAASVKFQSGMSVAENVEYIKRLIHAALHDHGIEVARNTVVVSPTGDGGWVESKGPTIQAAVEHGTVEPPKSE